MNNEKSPWFKAHEYRPTLEGPFECRGRQYTWPGEEDSRPTGSTHMRWYDAERMAWSHPLDYDEMIDDAIIKPPVDEFITTTHQEELDEYLTRFEWRGYNSDQEPL